MSTQSERESSTAAGPIPLSVPSLGGNEWAYVKECLDTNWISSAGPFVDRFEREVAALLDVRHAVAVSNGTSALHLSMLLSGVGPETEVIVPALTFIATLNAIRYCGGVPMILDVEPKYWQLDPILLARFLEDRCERKTDGIYNRATGRQIKAVLPVHLLGHPCEMDAIMEIAAQFRLPVVSDATQSLGASYRGKPAASLGEMACLSFNGNKTISCGGGGMLVTNDSDLAQRARYLSTQAKDDDVAYVHHQVGYNYRLTNVLAAIGVAQLELLEGHVEAKRRIARRYAEAFDGVRGLTFMSEASWAQSGYWLSTVLIDPDCFRMTNLDLMRHLRDEGVETRPLYQPMHRSPSQVGAPFFGSGVADHVHSQALNLPSSVSLTSLQQERVVDLVLSCHAT